MSDCENCIHKIRKLSKYGEIYACEKWICKPEYKENKDREAYPKK